LMCSLLCSSAHLQFVCLTLVFCLAIPTLLTAQGTSRHLRESLFFLESDSLSAATTLL